MIYRPAAPASGADRLLVLSAPPEQFALNAGACGYRRSVSLREKGEAAITVIGRGGVVVVIDDEPRENEGDLIMPRMRSLLRRSLSSRLTSRV